MLRLKEEIASLLDNSINKKDIESIQFLYENHANLFPVLWEIAKEKCQPRSWRACWVIEHLSANNANLLTPFLNDIYYQLAQQNHQGMKRTMLNLILRLPPTVCQVEILLEPAIFWLQNPNEAVAVRASAVRFLMAVYKIEPDFKSEFLEIMSLQLRHATSPALLSVLRNAIKTLEKKKK